MTIKNLLQEIDNWIKEGIITYEQGEIIKSKYKTPQKRQMYSSVIGIMGSVFVCVGLIVILAAFWNNLPYFIKSASAFIPLVLGFICSLLIIFLNIKSILVKEILSFMHCAGIFLTYKLVELIFEINTDYLTYILCCGIAILPIIFINKSCFCCAFYSFASINVCSIVVNNNQEGLLPFFIIVLISLSVFPICFYIHRYYKNKNSIIESIALWIIAVNSFALAIIFSTVSKTDNTVTLLLLFSIFSMYNNTKSDLFNSFSICGFVGYYTVLLLRSAGLICDIPDEYSIANIIYPLIIVTVLIIFYIFSNKSIKSTCILFSSIILTVLSLLSINISDSGNYPNLFITITLLIFLSNGIIFIVEGLMLSKVADINIGIITIFIVIFNFLKDNFDSIGKGVLILILGILFLIANFIISKRKKKKEYNYEHKS